MVAIPTKSLSNESCPSIWHSRKTDGFRRKTDAPVELTDANRQIRIVSWAGFVTTNPYQRLSAESS
jgi:hypothetical protein